VAPRIVPALPGISAFPEINVRTYVTVGGQPGVYFFSLDATNRLAVWAARTLFHLPYYSARIQIVRGCGDRLEYRSERVGSDAAFRASYNATTPPAAPARGSLEYFLVERYCLYTIGAAGQPSRVDVHH